MVTLAALSPEGLIATLRESYDSEDEYEEVSDEDIVDHIECEQSLTITVEEHLFDDVAVMLIGNPVDGFEVVGPYFNKALALEAGDTVATEWWVTPLHDPAE